MGKHRLKAIVINVHELVPAFTSIRVLYFIQKDRQTLQLTFVLNMHRLLRRNLFGLPPLASCNIVCMQSDSNDSI